jgi:hypothetical protein
MLSKTMRADVAGGFDMLPFPERLDAHGEIYRDIVTRHVTGFGCWEPFETEIVMEILATGDREGIVLDVGAQLGYYSIIAARYGYDVLAFEYDEEVLARLTESARINGLADRIEARRAFVGNRTDGIQKGGQRVTLDSLDLNRRVRLLKVDVEGFDPNVIDGAERLFRDRMVDFAIVEVSPKFANRTPFSRYVEMTQFIVSQGYRVFDIGLSGRRRVESDTSHLANLDGRAIDAMREGAVEAAVEGVDQTNFVFSRTH